MPAARTEGEARGGCGASEMGGGLVKVYGTEDSVKDENGQGESMRKFSSGTKRKEKLDTSLYLRLE